jgi:ribonuclease HI
MSDDPKVILHADESCLGNQFQGKERPGGAGGILEYWRVTHWERRDFWLSEEDTTNNRMALRSAIEGIGLLTRPCRIRFVSDSQYLVRGMTEWVRGWRARGWKRKGGALENLELWQELDRVASKHRVGWVWVRGHAGDPRNEYANHLATRAAKDQTNSGGAVESGFLTWLDQQRTKRKLYLDFFEDAPPAEDGFPPSGG